MLSGFLHNSNKWAFSTEYFLYPSLPTIVQVPVQEHISELGWIIVEYSVVKYYPLKDHVEYLPIFTKFR